MKKLNFNLILGGLVVTLSILATLAGYVGSNINGQGDSHTAKARQFLADANTDEGLALQYIMLDYAVFDGYYLNEGKDSDAAQYYYDNFSLPLV